MDPAFHLLQRSAPPPRQLGDPCLPLRLHANQLRLTRSHGGLCGKMVSGLGVDHPAAASGRTRRRRQEAAPCLATTFDRRSTSTALVKHGSDLLPGPHQTQSRPSAPRANRRQPWASCRTCARRSRPAWNLSVATCWVKDLPPPWGRALDTWPGARQFIADIHRSTTPQQDHGIHRGSQRFAQRHAARPPVAPLWFAGS